MRRRLARDGPDAVEDEEVGREQEEEQHALEDVRQRGGQVEAHLHRFAAIIVAFVGRLNAFGIVLAGLLMSLLFLGGEAVQMSLDLPAALTHIFQGMLLFFLLAADFFIFYRIRPLPREARAHASSPLLPSAEKQG
jgi:hypothetical protein